MTTTPEENDQNAAAPSGSGTTRPRRRRAASRPAGPPVRVEAPEPAADGEPPAVTSPEQPVGEVAGGTVEQTVPAAPAPPAPADTPAPEDEPAEEAAPAPRRRARRATRRTGTPAAAAEEAAVEQPVGEVAGVAVEQTVPTAPAAPEPAPEPVAEPIAEPAASEAPAPARRRRTSRSRATAPAEPAEVAAAQDRPVEDEPVQAPAEPVAEEPAADQAVAEEPAADQAVAEEPVQAPVDDPQDVMDDPVLLRAAGLAGRRERTAAERAAEAAARATAVFFQAPAVDEAPRRSRRASAPAGPPRPAAERSAQEPGEDAVRDAEDLLDALTTGGEDVDVEEGPLRPAAGEDDRSAPAGSDEDDDEDAGNRRRRRRGGRGRRGRTREDAERTDDEGRGDERDGDDDARAGGGEPGTPARAAAVDASDEDEDEDTGTDGDEGAEADEASGSSRRRRRRRRRGGAAEGDEPSPDDPPNTVVRVREPRRGRGSGGSTGGGTGEDEITALKGSTRLEAKKQRRREGREQGRKRAILTEAEFLARRESVERVMVVREKDGVTQIGVLEDGILVEHYGALKAQTTMVGNVYLGRVQNVLPSMEAAFVDVGKGRNAVLYAGEVNWDAAGLEGQPRRIEAALKSGDPVLVQVTKDPVGHKGARLTSQVSLPGRYLVYVPRGSMTGISRKLPDTERSRLKKVLKKVVPEGAGVIVRTAAEGVSEDELAADVQRLQATWESIQAKASSKNAPVLLHGEPDLTVRVVRDVFNEDFSRLVVSGAEAWETVHGYVGDVAPDLAPRLQRWESDEDVFAAHRVDEQLQKALGRKVWLPSGGSLVIDPTEAMHVIDVNTGKFTGSGGTLEETVTRNNLEAAEEIVRQLRLRDIGGIIVIDFIDMVLESNRDLVLRRLVECLGRDRTKHQVAEVTSLGLVQMTRKRTGQGLAAVLEELEAASAENASSGASDGGVNGSTANGSGAGTPASNGSNGGSGKSRGRRGRGSRDARAEEQPPAADPSAAEPAAREPGKDPAVLAAIAAVAAARRTEAAAAEASAAEGAAGEGAPAEGAGEQVTPGGGESF
ncbi:Rne/Rng family ribonuclease [Kineococcus auxinigenes]|uniref:Rne/Rng family ribonuclease n=1 Tax=unclassified Kineococcus TaxID=2621656 RepID=UPI003D7D3F24